MSTKTVETRSIQLMLVDMLKVFHDFCQKHSLRYFAIGGTALGAARHHGFIPWDDDIDIGMPRSDYELMIDIFNKENTNQRYVLESPFSPDPFFPYPYSKLYDTQTTVIENMYHPLKRGLFLDIFPLDGIGNTPKGADGIFRQINYLSFVRKMITCAPSPQKSRLRNLFLTISRPFIVLSGIKLKTIRTKIDRKCKRIQYDESDLVANFLGYWGEKEIVPKSVLGNPILLPFENIQICCPEKIDAYLTHVYGDWRTPPPKEKQITHHDIVYDLKKSYLEE